MSLTLRRYNTACTTWPEGGRAVIVQPNGALFEGGRAARVAASRSLTSIFAQPLAPKPHPQRVGEGRAVGAATAGILLGNPPGEEGCWPAAAWPTISLAGLTERNTLARGDTR